MVLGFGQQAGDDVATLIAKRNFSKAIEVIRNQLKLSKNDPRLRLQLADVLVSAGKGKESVSILLPLADEFAKEGFAAKAISVLKKIQKLEPGRRDIDQRLASLIQEKQRQATVAPTSAPVIELGIEEIGFEAPPAVAEPAPLRPEPVPPAPVRVEPPRPAPPPPPPAPPTEPEISLVDVEPEPLDLGLEAPAPVPEIQIEPAASEPVLEVSVELAPAPELAMAPEPEAAEAEFDLGEAAPPGDMLVLDSDPLDLGGPTAAVQPEPAPIELLPEPVAEPVAEPAPVVDQDLFTGEFEEAAPVEPEISVEPAPPPELVDPMTDSGFADELLSVIDEAFQAFPASPEASPGTDAAAAVPEGGTQIVVSPLFKDFSVEELVAVIQGLNLQTYERGQVILREGQPGSSLYMLTSGTVKAFVKRSGKQVAVGELEEGAFFGEVSILTGKPRTATVVATSHCELLELDRATLDSITQTHPHVWDVLQEFANQRMAKA